MDILSSIPDWFTGVIMIITAGTWFLASKYKIRPDTRAIGYTLILWGILYTISSFLSLTGSAYSELLIKVLVGRLVIIVLCLSQAIPITIFYFLGIRRENGHRQ